MLTYIIVILSKALHVNVVALKAPNICSLAVHCQYIWKNYSINQLLYGIEDSTLKENKTLFIVIQQFLVVTGSISVGSLFKLELTNRYLPVTGRQSNILFFA